MNTIYTDYNNCLTNVTNSILNYYGLETYHKTLDVLDDILNEREYKNIVYMLYDGMGANLLKRNLNSNDFLNQNKIANVHAVFPPTTTASTTSVLSGKNPNEHGWLGWDLYFKKIDKTVSMFINTIKDTDISVSEGSISRDTYPYDSIVDRIANKVNSVELFPFGDNPYNGIDDMHNKIIEICENNQKNFIYAYLEELDHTMHEMGTDSKETINLFRMLNDKTENLCSRLKNTLVILIADHGHINSENINLNEYPDIFSLLERETSIESRAAAFFIKNDKQAQFRELFNKYFGEYFTLYTREEVIEKQLFGTGKNNENFSEVIGDFLAVATSNKYFRYNEKSMFFKSTHAGITEDEVLVPLIIYKGE